MTGCVFCPANWLNLDIVQTIDDNFAVVNPLDPVTEGHVLLICGTHTQDAADANTGTDVDGFKVAADLMYLAGQYVWNHRLQANIITSIGPHATQTVMHTHVHIVPRRENDKLMLPWTLQHLRKEREKMMDELFPQRRDSMPYNPDYEAGLDHAHNVWVDKARAAGHLPPLPPPTPAEKITKAFEDGPKPTDGDTYAKFLARVRAEADGYVEASQHQPGCLCTMCRARGYQEDHV
jgi:diadenosine tetraphosphate (Ap4A) HIT family hydrolase